MGRSNVQLCIKACKQVGTTTQDYGSLALLYMHRALYFYSNFLPKIELLLSTCSSGTSGASKQAGSVKPQTGNSAVENSIIQTHSRIRSGILCPRILSRFEGKGGFLGIWEPLKVQR